MEQDESKPKHDGDHGPEDGRPAQGGMPGDEPDLPFPGSLCHTCAAPPKYIRTSRSTFLFCPLFRRYPPQPVLECTKYVSVAAVESKRSAPAPER